MSGGCSFILSKLNQWFNDKLQSLMDEASRILQDRDNILKVTTTHLRSKVMPEAQDAVVEDHS